MTATKHSARVAGYISVVGPTASGKSAFALELARQIGGEIVNADSIQLYRGFDIGAAKPSAEERAIVPHHMFDVADWQIPFDASRYATAAREVIAAIAARKQTAIVVGGSGLYLRALAGERFHDLPQNPKVRAELNEQDGSALFDRLAFCDPGRAKELHPNDRVRIIRALEINIISSKTVAEVTKLASAAEWPPILQIFIQPERAALHLKIEQRCDAMLAQGFIDEVRGLLAAGCPQDAAPMRSIGYRQAAAFIMGDGTDAEKLRQAIVAATRQYAKRQITWFRKTPNDVEIDSPCLDKQLLAKVEKQLGR